MLHPIIFPSLIHYTPEVRLEWLVFLDRLYHPFGMEADTLVKQTVGTSSLPIMDIITSANKSYEECNNYEFSSPNSIAPFSSYFT